MPLLWVVPLALYLLTYVMAFSRRTVLPGRWVLHAQAGCVVVLSVVLAHAVPRVEKSAALFPVHLAAFFLTALVCHRELARLRPASRHLTRFYLTLSAGGVLGGVFNTLLAPQLFPSFAEYPLVLVAACLLRPAPAARRGRQGPGARRRPPGRPLRGARRGGPGARRRRGGALDALRPGRRGLPDRRGPSGPLRPRPRGPRSSPAA